MHRDTLTKLQLAKLNALLKAVRAANPFYQQKLSAWRGERLSSLAEIDALPFTVKQELLDDQAAYPPYGSNLTAPLEKYVRYHQTSGSRGVPLRWLDTAASWDWFLECWRLIFAAAGVTAQDRLFFPFSFGPFIGFWAAFEGACRLGRLSLPGGGMTSLARLRTILENQITLVCCTPTYALHLIDTARKENLLLAASAVRALILAGEPGASIPATRERIEAGFGARVFDHYGMTEIGSLGAECAENPGGFHLLETECLPEILDPTTGQPVPLGQEGELVITNLGRWGSPVIRYRTGDRVIADPQPCPCGRPWLRVQGGIRGRTDDMVIIKGNNVYPSMIEAVVRRFPEVSEFQIRVNSSGPQTQLQVVIEAAGDGSAVARRVAEALRDAYLFRPDVIVAPPGSLPRSEMKAQRLVRP
jgi:phenylacetate-CoA ligase